MEKRIKVSTQGRITIPKAIRDEMKIQDGLSIIIRTNNTRREVIIELMSTMNDFASSKAE